jgi:hypothetical protein
MLGDAERFGYFRARRKAMRANSTIVSDSTILIPVETGARPG